MTFDEIEVYINSFKSSIGVKETSRKSSVIDCLKSLSSLESEFGESELFTELREVFLYTSFDEKRATGLLNTLRKTYESYPQFTRMIGHVSIVNNIRKEVKERLRLYQNLSKLKSGEFSFTTLKALMSAVNRVTVAYEKTGNDFVKDLAVFMLSEVHYALIHEKYSKKQIKQITTFLLG